MKRFERSEITAGEAARILGITRQSVHGRIRSGSLIPIGRSVDGVYVFSRGYVEGVRDDEQAKSETDTRPGVLSETTVP